MMLSKIEGAPFLMQPYVPIGGEGWGISPPWGGVIPGGWRKLTWSGIRPPPLPKKIQKFFSNPPLQKFFSPCPFPPSQKIFSLPALFPLLKNLIPPCPFPPSPKIIWPIPYPHHPPLPYPPPLSQKLTFIFSTYIFCFPVHIPLLKFFLSSPCISPSTKF